VTDKWPAVTCLCPTYGRFERLRDAVACFLLQDYPGPRRLLIFNDADQGIRLSDDMEEFLGAPIMMWNHVARFATLGHKRQALLQAAQTPLVAHWDDDDLYLPWHLSCAVRALLGCDGAACAKARAAWYAKGPRDGWTLAGKRCNLFEGQMVFKRLAALALEQPAYPPLHSGQAAALWAEFGRLRVAHPYRPPTEWLSYVYRWADGPGHASLGKNKVGAPGLFAKQNQDFGGAAPLISGPDPLAWARQRLAVQFRHLADEIERTLGSDAAAQPAAQLRAAVGGRPRGGRDTLASSPDCASSPADGGQPQSDTTGAVQT